MTDLSVVKNTNSQAFDVEAIRRDFPILAQEINGKPLVYLDNGASAQKPVAVLNAWTATTVNALQCAPWRPYTR